MSHHRSNNRTVSSRIAAIRSGWLDGQDHGREYASECLQTALDCADAEGEPVDGEHHEEIRAEGDASRWTEAAATGADCSEVPYRWRPAYEHAYTRGAAAVCRHHTDD